MKEVMMNSNFDGVNGMSGSVLAGGTGL